MPGWYLIYTKPNGEALATANLARQDYDVYFPRIVQTVRRASGWKDKILPLFPRYVFLRLDRLCQSLSAVRSTIGVAAIVRFGSTCSVVPDRVIADLRLRADPILESHWRGRRVRLAAGGPVLVTGGPFAGLEGIFEREAGADRVDVLLQLLGDGARVRLSADFIRPCVAA